ncbi:SDR family oxidoreductase [Moheibacter sediminis]|uniref:Short-chain dehydrogenase n=1 Tax=Moheibacter sediminis TaxID=1434700 RepID=A0A1W2BVY4_9FLAO|nr:SDR family oxidoreductase [Moheibacter sediminis]SMC77137.1 Short-chain dehydrogenase [Moheibacter sediminis]
MNKNIIITGASRGIGRELAKIHLLNGNNVLAISRNAEKLEELKMFENNSQFRFLSLDLADYNSLNQITQAIQDWNKVDVLYNNAGLLVNKPFAEITESDIDYSIDVNYKGPFRLIQLILDKTDFNSHIVNITTMGAVQGSLKFPGLGVYSSSKAGLVTLTELLAQEFNENQPRINCIALGAVQTEMLEEAFPGYIAPISAEETAEYLYNFGLNGHRYQNGKVIQLSTTTP